MTERIAITGAAGFIGQQLLSTVSHAGYAPLALLRGEPSQAIDAELAVIGDLAESSGLEAALSGVSAVVHLAAYTHSGDSNDADAEGRYRQTNVAATVRLAKAARAARVSNFVFMSSIKVNGERTSVPGHAPERFSPALAPAPEDHYGRTKLQAEQALISLFANSDTRLCILRPPLVYGPGLKGNLLKLFEWVARGYPLPLASVNNRRSLIYVGNLVEAVVLGCRQSRPSCIYTLADVDLSTPQLIAEIARSLKRPSRLWPCPRRLLAAAATFAGRQSQWQRLSDSLLVESSAIGRELGWQPRTNLTEAMDQTAHWFQGLNR